MGRRIIQGMATPKESQGRTKDDNTFDVSSSLDSTEQYLCNIPPHRCGTQTWSGLLHLYLSVCLKWALSR